MHSKLAILHAHNTYNNGSFMMLINFIWYYVKNLPKNSQVTFWIELDGADNQQRLIQALPKELLKNKKLVIESLPVKITSIDNSSFLQKIVRLYIKLFCHPGYFKKLGIESVVILGGDDISEYYKKWMILSDLYRIYRYTKFFTTYLVGQTIGPFTGGRKKFAAKCLSNTTIFCRDSITTNYLKDELSINPERVYEAADLCFPELPKPEVQEDILHKYSLTADGYLTLVPGGYFSLYTLNKNDYLSSWTRIVNDLLELKEHRTKKLVFLPHVTRPEDDREMIELITNLLSEKGKLSERICVIEDELLPHQLREILGNGYFTITSRMHAALSTFQMKKPAIALAYSIKYDGVIGQSVQCPELIVHCSAEMFSNQEIVSQEVLLRISYIAVNYFEIYGHLNTRIDELKILAENQIKHLVKENENKE